MDTTKRVKYSAPNEGFVAPLPVGRTSGGALSSMDIDADDAADDGPLFIAEALQCVQFTLMAPDGTTGPSFAPEYAHQIFGDTELIRGYVNPKINFTFSSCSMDALLEVSWEAVDAETASFTSISDVIMPWLDPSAVTTDKERFLAAQKQQQLQQLQPATPLGQCVFSEDDVRIYFAPFSLPGVTEFHRKIRPFCIWYIDGARYLDEEDSRWHLYTLWKVNCNGTYMFAGYTTCYPYFCMRTSSSNPSTSKRDAIESLIGSAAEASAPTALSLHPTRYRISQMLILPPFQKQSLASRVILPAIYKNARALYGQTLLDITVEDPSDAFQGMRDYSDCLLLVPLLSKNPETVKWEQCDRVLSEQGICVPQRVRIYHIWMLMRVASMGADAEEFAQTLKTHLLSFHSADIPTEDEATKNLVLDELCKQRVAQYQRVLFKLNKA